MSVDEAMTALFVVKDALTMLLTVVDEEAAAVLADVMADTTVELDTLAKAEAILVSCDDSSVEEEPATDTTIATLVVEVNVGGGVGTKEGAAVGEAEGCGVGAAGENEDVTVTENPESDVDVIPTLALIIRL